MAKFPADIDFRVLPVAIIRELGVFLEQYSQEDGVRLWRNSQSSSSVLDGLRFWLLSGPCLTVLIIGQPWESHSPAQNPPRLNSRHRLEPGAPQAIKASPEQCQLGLTFDLRLIETFLQTWQQEVHEAASTADRLPALPTHLSATTPEQQSRFTLALLDVLSHVSLRGHRHLACEPVQAALDKQLYQSLLLNKVVTKIQESLELSEILQTTVAEVQQFLQADRLLIYQLDVEAADDLRPIAVDGAALTGESNLLQGSEHGGYITYESRANTQLVSVLHYTESYCFQEMPHCRARFLGGAPYAIDDVESTYQETPCLLNFLQRVEVKSKLIAPILVNQNLWGLLIAHQCQYQRQWQPWELRFLQHIAEHLAIAINQAELYHQLQEQTHNLEACVVERTQDLRDALAAAQSANRAKSEFLSTMSHELRTPLTCIIGMSATLLRWSFGDLSPRQRDYLTTIHDSGEHLLTLINDILEVSKIESGRTVLEVSAFSLTSLCRQSLDGFRAEASKKGLELSLELSLTADTDHFVADPRRVRQILVNLISNAIKFTTSGGKVTLRGRREQGVAVFQIEDTGIGIPESQQSLLFEKFQQLENARQRQYQGTGLGLALTKQLVDLHGGSITVKSKVGMGSVFTVRIPSQRLADRDTSPSGADSGPPEPVVGRIVLVEDNEESASLICDMLTAAEYQVIWVIEGSRVLEQVGLLQPTAVIVNVNLVGSSGYDTIRSLRQYVSTSGIRLLALVEGTVPEQTESAFQAGANAVLAKPIDPENLLSVVNTLMASPLP